MKWLQQTVNAIILCSFMVCTAVSADLTINPAGTGDHPTIQAGIDAATAGETVWLEDGTYSGTGNRNINFTGKAITVCSLSNEPGICIVDCGTSTRGVLFESGETQASVLKGITVRNGSAGFNAGGGILCDGSSPLIENCVVTSSSALYGGGIGCSGGAAVIDGCVITGNSGSWYCGGIGFTGGSAAEIRNSTISNNNGNGGGGGIACQTSSPSIIDCLITGNTADAGAGIMCYENASPSITRCTVTGNTAVNDGGGLQGYDTAHPVIIDSTFSGNMADTGGGLFFNSYCEPVITRCLILQNSVTNDGGGLACTDYCVITLINCTIAENEADDDSGGLECYRWSDMGITNCTVSGNTGGSDGGGILVGSHSSATVVNSIFWNNSAPDGPEIYLMNDVSSLTAVFSDVAGGSSAVHIESACTLNWGPGMIGTDPLFTGGIPYDYHLVGTSFCIDAGTDDTGTWPDIPTDDIDGDLRPSGSGFEMGSDEVMICIRHGDVNFSGTVTAGDAQMAFEIALELITPTVEEACAADCTGDGSVTAGDAQAIFNTALGTDTCVDPIPG